MQRDAACPNLKSQVSQHLSRLNRVIPAKAGIQAASMVHWIPAFAGMTEGRIFMVPGAAQAA